jgi:hypothetical protein
LPGEIHGLLTEENMCQRKLVMVLLLVWGAYARADDLPPANHVKEPELRLELLSRDKVDQEARSALIAWLRQHGKGGMIDPAALGAEQMAEFEKLGAAVKKADQKNTERLGEIVDKHGWPTKTLVGKDGSHSAWLLIQHADEQTKFQRKCLDLMAKVPRDEVSQTDLAYLTDRVLLAEGKKQLFGTQFTFSDGKWEPCPLEDATNVDQRRTEAGLQPLAEYVKELESAYGITSKK